MRSLGIFSLGLATLSTIGCGFALAGAFGVVGTGPSKTDARKVGSFSKINLSNGLDVAIKVGSPSSVSVTAKQSLLPLVTTKVKGDELFITTTKPVSGNSPVHVAISVPDLSALSASGGVSVDLSNLDSKDFDLKGSGGVSVALRGQADSFTAELSGGCSLSLKGSAKRATLNGEGGATIDATKFPIQSAKVTAEGGCTIDLGMTQSLVANAGGGSSISYKGHPTLVKTTSGAGSVEAH